MLAVKPCDLSIIVGACFSVLMLPYSIMLYTGLMNFEFHLSDLDLFGMSTYQRTITLGELYFTGKRLISHFDQL